MKKTSIYSVINYKIIFLGNRKLKNRSISAIFILSAICLLIQTPINDILSLSDANLDQIETNCQFKVDQWTPHSPIFVHGIINFTQTAAAESWPGDGTKANPYRIEGYNITGAGELIVIQNTPLYFKISDCFLNETSRIGRGIVINGSSNGIIEDTMLFSSYYGIELIRSNYTLIQRVEITNQSIGIIVNSSHGNNIYQNVIANNLDYGVSIINNSSYNTVAWNNWYVNGGVTSEAYDEGSNNIFSFNYWSALTTPDNDGNGIVDVPYLIDGEVNNRDMYPLVTQPPMYVYPDIPVLLEPKILYPNGGEINLTGLITINWLKALDAKNHLITYSIDYSTDNGITWSSMISGLEQTYFEWDLTNVYSDSTYIIRVTALGSEGISNFDISDGSFSVIGLDPPLDTTTTTTIGSTNPDATTTLTNPQTTPTVPPSTSEIKPNALEPYIPIAIAILLILLLISLPIIYRKREAILTIITKSKDNSLQDLLRKRAVTFDTLAEELQCNRLDLPKKIKSDLGEKIKGSSLVFRSGMISLENIPPTGTMCQVCTGSLEGKTYFQCRNCLRYVCLPHFVDLKKLDEEACPNCDGQLYIFPFTCEGCNIDYNQIIDMESNLKNCKHCGFPFPPQNRLILDSTKEITSTVALNKKEDYSDTKKKKM